jgi:hypothetical protein
MRRLPRIEDKQCFKKDLRQLSRVFHARSLTRLFVCFYAVIWWEEAA